MEPLRPLQSPALFPVCRQALYPGLCVSPAQNMLGQHAPALPRTHPLSSLDGSHPITALRPCPLGVPAGTPPPSAPLTPNPPSSNGLCGAEGGAASGSRVGLQHTLRLPVDKKQGKVSRPGGAGWHRAASAPGQPGTGQGPATFTASRPKGAGVLVCEGPRGPIWEKVLIL